MSHQAPEVSLIIPVYNEAAHIAQSLRKIEEELGKSTQSYEIVVVDDGSKDASWEQLSMLAQTSRHYKAFRLSRNFGKELALCAGLEHARGQAVIIMDGDLQHPPELLARMIRLWREQGKDIVECVKSDRGSENLNKSVGSAIFYNMLNQLSGFDLKGASDFKLLDRKVVQAWREMPERTTFFRGMTAWLGYDREKIYFEVPSRAEGSSQWNFWSLMKLAVQAVVSFSSIPLRMVSMFGLVFLIGAGVLFVQTLYQKFIGNAVDGFTTVILLLLIVGSVIMISLGIIGEYIAAIYNEVKGRPRYLIKDHINSETSEQARRVSEVL
ncbi:glycosyltransferase family 2 protein [Paenibacillus thalictri]|uniref:Glycosyltransferase n=1 Tax=Paenibacillus thalictri TaxID=2527873 RepID=A0A4Q9DH43_9BACL|nr:glycosyltransferase family 2 protein [Paenibacillus thalictri]TBL69299.1 glycosyltransferase [Paenibacillus thalictri]